MKKSQLIYSATEPANTNDTWIDPTNGMVNLKSYKDGMWTPITPGSIVLRAILFIDGHVCWTSTHTVSIPETSLYNYNQLKPFIEKEEPLDNIVFPDVYLDFLINRGGHLDGSIRIKVDNIRRDTQNHANYYNYFLEFHKNYNILGNNCTISNLELHIPKLYEDRSKGIYVLSQNDVYSKKRIFTPSSMVFGKNPYQLKILAGPGERVTVYPKDERIPIVIEARDPITGKETIDPTLEGVPVLLNIVLIYSNTNVSPNCPIRIIIKNCKYSEFSNITFTNSLEELFPTLYPTDKCRVRMNTNSAYEGTYGDFIIDIREINVYANFAVCNITYTPYNTIREI